MIKAIVCDMDGTLLNSENRIEPKTKEKLLQMQREGTILVLASGRSYQRLLPDALKLEMDKFGGCIIGVNGSTIYDCREKVRERIGIMDKDAMAAIIDFFRLFEVEIQFNQDESICTYLPDSIYEIKRNIRGEMRLPDDYPWTGGMYSWLCDTRDGYPTQIMTRDLKKIPDSCNKMSIVQETQYMQFIRSFLPNASIWDQFEFVFSDPRKLEITKKGISKGKTLDCLLEERGISQDELVVFGDSENDISMFKNKKYAVAMGNALPIAKAAATHVTAGNNEEGIYQFLVELEAGQV